METTRRLAGRLVADNVISTEPNQTETSVCSGRRMRIACLVATRRVASILTNRRFLPLQYYFVTIMEGLNWTTMRRSPTDGHAPLLPSNDD